jgi:uncharacterized protein YfaT (DUF1175 family)
MSKRLAMLAALAALTIAALAFSKRPAPVLRATIDRTQLWADGYDVATVTIGANAVPTIALSGNPHIAAVGPLEKREGEYTSEIRAGVLPGSADLRVTIPGAKPIHLKLTTALATRDSRDDGTPDFLRLDSARSRAAFRRWFTFLAEAQYFNQPEARPAEISDCAALIRYAYREALRAHDTAWSAASALPLLPAFESPGKYEYPYTALGANLFRVTPGPFREADMNAAFAQFADAKTLWRYNTRLVSRDLRRAEPGDLLLYRQTHEPEPETYHSMIFLGASQIRPDGANYVIYHTGPQGNGPGEIRRLTMELLFRFPVPEWRPDPENPRFLGVYRWNILSGMEPTF